jgi:hypothetical protein
LTAQRLKGSTAQWLGGLAAQQLHSLLDGLMKSYLFSWVFGCWHACHNGKTLNFKIGHRSGITKGFCDATKAPDSAIDAHRFGKECQQYSPRRWEGEGEVDTFRGRSFLHLRTLLRLFLDKLKIGFFWTHDSGLKLLGLDPLPPKAD